jgi:hypothetical protein
MGMTGTIFVAAPNVPPTVAITNPAAGMVFSEPATIKLAATAADADGAVTNIQFFQGALSLTNLAGGPFLVSVSNLAAGSYVFTAVASDNGGLTATNAITNSVVTPVPVAINSPSRLLPSGFQFNYSANVGLRYIVQSSTSLFSTNWLTLATNTAAASPVIFMDANATSNPGFYRVGLLPNP